MIALAGAAGELLAHVLDHLPLPRDQLQRLGHVLADLAQTCRRSTGRPPAPDRRRARAADARAAGGAPACAARSCAPRSFASRRSLRSRAVASACAASSSSSASCQFELLEDRAALRGLPELLVPQLGDRELAASRSAARGAWPRSRPRWRAPPPPATPRASATDHRGRSGKIGRQRINGERHDADTESQNESACELQSRARATNSRGQPATAGRHVRCGSRQSIPSSK